MKFMEGAICSVKVRAGDRMIWVRGNITKYLHQSGQYAVDSDNHIYFCYPHEVLVPIDVVETQLKKLYEGAF